jgi:hypothetical protein
MKKKFLLVSVLVAMSMSAMFVACSGKNEPSSSSINGCTCMIRDSDGSSNEYFSKADMADVGATTCGELASAIRGMYGSHGMSVTVSCN